MIYTAYASEMGIVFQLYYGGLSRLRRAKRPTLGYLV